MRRRTLKPPAPRKQLTVRDTSGLTEIHIHQGDRVTVSAKTGRNHSDANTNTNYSTEYYGITLQVETWHGVMGVYRDYQHATQEVERFIEYIKKPPQTEFQFKAEFPAVHAEEIMDVRFGSYIMQTLTAGAW